MSTPSATSRASRSSSEAESGAGLRNTESPPEAGLPPNFAPASHRYIPYTQRLPLVEEFTPEEGEDRLYHLVSEYLQRDNLQALPASQRSLMTLVLRKLLASSTFAIAGALTTISNRLKARLRKQQPADSLEEELDQDYEALDETAEEWDDDEAVEQLTESDRKALEQEIADLDSFAALATSIDHNAKGRALLKALGVAFAKAQERARNKKPSSSPSHERPRITCCACWQTALIPKALCCLTAPTPMSAQS